MSLSIILIQRRVYTCPDCGREVVSVDEETVFSRGKGWYPFLEMVAYCVPDSKEDDWYGKDMVLCPETARDLYNFLRDAGIYNASEVRDMIAHAMMQGDSVVINAAW